MKILRPLLRWTLLLAVLAAVGYVTFQIVRHRPRCTITGPYDVVHFSGDGARLLTVEKKPTKPPSFGPLLVWDTHSGRVAGTLLGGAESLPPPRPPNRLGHILQRSPDGRHVAVSASDGLVRILDWHTGETWTVAGPKNVAELNFSEQAAWLFVRGHDPPCGLLIDIRARQAKLRLDEDFMEFSRDERWAFTPKSKDKSISVWELAKGQEVAVLEAELGTLTSPNGQVVITWRRDYEFRPADPWDESPRPHRGIDVWSVPDGGKRFRVDAAARDVQVVAKFSPNSQRLAIWPWGGSRQPSKIEMRDAESGKELWNAPTRDPGGGEFTPDGQLFYLYQGNDTGTFTMYDVATGDILWSRRVRGMPLFVPGKDMLLFKESRSAPLEWLDPRTGEQRGYGPADFGMNWAVPTPDGHHVLVNGWQGQERHLYFWERWLEKWLPGEFSGNGAIVILESATGRELFRVVNRGTQSRMLSDDGSTLVTVDLHPTTRDSLIRVWDVHPGRAWRWAVGAAAVAWLAGWLLRRLGRIVRARRTTSAPPFA